MKPYPLLWVDTEESFEATIHFEESCFRRVKDSIREPLAADPISLLSPSFTPKPEKHWFTATGETGRCERTARRRPKKRKDTPPLPRREVCKER